jgi:hypothetical protein
MGNEASMNEFEKFDVIVNKVFSVTRAEILRREKEYQRKRKRTKEQQKKAKGKSNA